MIDCWSNHLPRNLLFAAMTLLYVLSSDQWGSSFHSLNSSMQMGTHNGLSSIEVSNDVVTHSSWFESDRPVRCKKRKFTNTGYRRDNSMKLVYRLWNVVSGSGGEIPSVCPSIPYVQPPNLSPRTPHLPTGIFVRDGKYSTWIGAVIVVVIRIFRCVLASL